MTVGRILISLASLAGLALLLRSLVFGPVPLWVAVLALVLYTVLAVLGALVPHLEMYGDVVWRGLPGARGVALTFDDGPDPKTTPKILAALERHGARATFFVLGEKAERHPEVVRAIAAAGHALEMHGYRHDRLLAFRSPRRIKEQIEQTRDVVEKLTGGRRPRWFRPPLGHVSPRTAVAARKAQVELVAWSVRGLDGWAGRRPEAVVRRVTRGLGDGAIVLLHDAAERADFAPASIEALPRILDRIAELGLATVTIDDLIDVDRV